MLAMPVTVILTILFQELRAAGQVDAAMAAGRSVVAAGQAAMADLRDSADQRRRGRSRLIAAPIDLPLFVVRAFGAGDALFALADQSGMTKTHLPVAPASNSRNASSAWSSR